MRQKSIIHIILIKKYVIILQKCLKEYSSPRISLVMHLDFRILQNVSYDIPYRIQIPKFQVKNYSSHMKLITPERKFVTLVSNKNILLRYKPKKSQKLYKQKKKIFHEFAFKLQNHLPGGLQSTFSARCRHLCF